MEFQSPRYIWFYINRTVNMSGETPALYALQCRRWQFGGMLGKGATLDVESVDAMIEAAVYELTHGFIEIGEAVAGQDSWKCKYKEKGRSSALNFSL